MSSGSKKEKEEPQRIIGRWTIGATLGKGGYSWVKRGQDIKTGKIVALKFMEKADVSWVKEQAKQVETEIEALKNIRHPNVMKLYAYNLNAQYPLAPGSDDTHDFRPPNNASISASDSSSKSATNDKDKNGSNTNTNANGNSTANPTTGTASNDNSKKPEQQYIDTILLVLEYAPGGELFDILYYTSALNEKVARTYFKQIVNGLEACHNANVVHRDLKPQNLLLDAKYNVKITDFGLSKIIQSDADAIMKTTYVGTRGYQAPELLLNQKYDLKCDIFSIGVILFILLAGYPPFEQASKNDKWFRPLTRGQVDKFWRAHGKSKIIELANKHKADKGTENGTAKDLLTRMLSPEPKKRIDIASIKKHEWFNGETLKPKELILEIRDRHRKAEKKRRMDVRKMNDLAQSFNPNRQIPGIEENTRLKLYPLEQVECMFGECYTYLEPKQPWYDLYNLIGEAITDVGKGVAKFDKGVLNCQMVVQDINKTGSRVGVNNEDNEHKVDTGIRSVSIEFRVEIFESRLWKDRYLELEESQEIFEKKQHQIFVVRISRTEGDPLVFNRVKKQFMLKYCSSILKGLPQWARNLEDNDMGEEEIDEEPGKNNGEIESPKDDEKDPELVDEYSKEIGNIFAMDNQKGLQL